MPPPRQPYAFASSNPSAASSSQTQNQFYNQQQQPNQPGNAPRRGYAAAPGAASAVSLLPPGQRNTSTDSVVRIFPLDHPCCLACRSHCSLFSQHANPFNPSRSSVHTISGKVRNMLVIDILAHFPAALSSDALLCPDRRCAPLRCTGQPSPLLSQASQSSTTGLPHLAVDSPCICITARSTPTPHHQPNERFPPSRRPKSPFSASAHGSSWQETGPKCGAYGFVTKAKDSLPVACT